MQAHEFMQAIVAAYPQAAGEVRHGDFDNAVDNWGAGVDSPVVWQSFPDAEGAHVQVSMTSNGKCTVEHFDADWNPIQRRRCRMSGPTPGGAA